MNKGSASEEELRGWFLQGLSGNSHAYRTFLEEVAGMLRAYFRRRLAGLPDDIEDLVQESLLAIHNMRQTYNPELPITAWIYAIAHYKLVDLMRHRQHYERQTDSFDDGTGREPVAPEHDEMAGHDLAILLGQLSDRQRLTITQTKLQGLSVAETAKRDHMSESSVRVNVHRGIKTLKKLVRGDASKPPS